jgi:hypothetical protein
MNTGPVKCTHWIGAEQRHCGATPARRFANWWACAGHTPAALAGHDEPPEGNGPLPGAWTTPTPDAASWAAIDAKHIRTGKRRSNPADYQAARAAENRTN